ncbi:nuclear receptor-binding protein homolog isoform X2 [Coccinella septempunctata]|uniref:nuclear receptor-binding protein homolog isoform X2 n=1 Tax=Coccinella septempunctata TaxID=41139 RepID=UPI001D062C58|nr:nuclear receptor-binding protein homolog isoform X2 [Coccinella septempunctata]
MSGTHMNNDQEHKSPRESGEDSEDESEILEESPCGRWLKRREEVEQRDVPGIDCAYLAMDTEEGVEVVWNEVQFSERKNFKNQEEKIQLIFENLTQLEHPNIVKFHRYWTDTHNDKPRVIFITEYMSSGSLKQFLKRTKRNVKRLPLQAWKRWCTQILSALSYLHSCSPPIIHGNLTCDTIFIQHNGLVKIGSGNMGPPMDIYSFGMCALEMAALEIFGNGDSGNKVTEENIKKTIESLEDEQQKDFIQKCLQTEPQDRPTAKDLLFHSLLFEVHTLKLLAAHCLVRKSANISETITDELMQRWYGPDVIVAEVRRDGQDPVQMKMADVQNTEKLEKFVEDVKNGIYPLTAFGAKLPPPPRSRAISPEMAESVKSVTPEPVDIENRKIINMMCDVKSKEETCDLVLTIVLRMDDKMNRQLTSCISPSDSPKELAQELVHYGFINEVDRDKIASLIEESMQNQCPASLHNSPVHHQNNNTVSFHSMTPATLDLTTANGVAVTQQPPNLATPPIGIVNSTPHPASTQVPMHTTS